MDNNFLEIHLVPCLNLDYEQKFSRDLLTWILLNNFLEMYKSGLRTNKFLEIHLVPCLNPDGYTSGSRHNANDEDLNRGFPGWRDVGKSRYMLYIQEC